MNITETLRKLQPYFAAGVFIMICASVYFFYEFNEINKQIAENCGWEEELYRCYCEKDYVVEMEEFIDDKMKGDYNVTLDWECFNEGNC